MKKATTSQRQRNLEHTKTMKYIVNGPVPKAGQSASSGGIREGGKIQAQYKDPVPYVEPTAPTLSTKFAEKRMLQVEKIKADLLAMAWGEIGRPLSRKAFNKVYNAIVSVFEETSQKSTPVAHNENTGTKEFIKRSSMRSESVIPFPTERIS